MAARDDTDALIATALAAKALQTAQEAMRRAAESGRIRRRRGRHLGQRGEGLHRQLIYLKGTRGG